MYVYDTHKLFLCYVDVYACRAFYVAAVPIFGHLGHECVQINPREEYRLFDFLEEELLSLDLLLLLDFEALVRGGGWMRACVWW